MRDFKKLSVWEKAHQLTLNIYQSTDQFPNDERYELTSQMRRSASSIPSNIAEGCGRISQPQLKYRLWISIRARVPNHSFPRFGIHYQQ